MTKRYETIGFAALIFLGWGSITAVGNEIITIRSGNGTASPCTNGSDALVRVLVGTPGVPMTAFNATTFATWNTSPYVNATVVTAYPGWLASLNCDSAAKWVSVNCSRGPAPALYAIPFNVQTECAEAASLAFCFAAADVLGGPTGDPNHPGLYLNGTAIPGTTWGGIANIQTTFNLSIPGSMIQHGQNVLYVYARDIGEAVASGAIFSATFNITPFNVSGSICGTKFNDLNCDGVRQANELGLGGWTIIAINQATGEQYSAVTNGPGGYCINNLPPGTYQVLEQPQAGWVQTKPKCDTPVVTVVCPPGSIVVDFGNCPCPPGNLDQELFSASGCWQLISEPPPGNGSVPRQASLVSPAAGWYNAGPWVSASPTGNVNLPAGDYTYQCCFCLDPRFTNPSLSICLAAKVSADAYLNGQFFGGTTTTASCTTIAVPNVSLFKAGQNCIQIVVHNPTGGPSGFYVLGAVHADNGRCCPRTACPCAAPPSDMVGWWPLDELVGTKANDIAPLANNGTHNGGPLAVGGMVGLARNYNGAGDSTVVPMVPPINFTTLNVYTGDFTVDCWVKTLYTGASYRACVDKLIVNPGPFGSSFGYSLGVRSGNAYCYLIAGPITSTSATGAWIADGQWHHIAMSVIRNSVTGGKLYVDGAPVNFDPTDQSGVSLSNNAPFRIGANQTSYFSGSIDEVELFKRALSPAEILSIYQAGSEGKCKERCILPKWVSCVNGSAAISVGVYNGLATPQTYVVTPIATGCPGLGAFNPLSKPLTVPPFTWRTATFTVPCTSLAPGQTGCYCVDILNVATGKTFSCCGTVYRWLHLSARSPAASPLGLALDQMFHLPITVTNEDLPPGSVPYRIDALYSESDALTDAVRLNALPPATPVLGMLILPPPGGSSNLEVDLTLVGQEAFQTYDLQLSADTDADGIWEPIFTIALVPRPYLRGDMNCDGLIDVDDILCLVNTLLTPDTGAAQCPDCPVDNADTNGDGLLDGRDCQTMIELILSKSW